MTTTDTKTPAAAKAARSRSKAKTNGSRVDELNARRELPTRTELIAEAQALGVEGPISRMKVKDLHAAVELKKALATTPQVDAAKTQAKRASGPGGIAAAVAAAPAPNKAKPQVQPRRTTRGPRGVQARKEADRLGKRGPGRKVTDAELIEYAAKVRKAHPETNASDELEYAYWIEKLAISSWTRWEKAWEAADPK